MSRIPHKVQLRKYNTINNHDLTCATLGAAGVAAVAPNTFVGVVVAAAVAGEDEEAPNKLKPVGAA